MKYVILSDIHSNYEALNTVLDYINKNLSDYSFICLGDIIGYGPSPVECLDEIFSRTKKIVLGNHDAGVIGKTEIMYFNKYAKESIEWTRKQISRKHKSLLKKLNYSIEENGILFTHTDPSNPASWSYILSIYDAYEQFSNIENKISFIGHTHIPLVYEFNGEKVRINFDEIINIEENKRYIVNVGSIGQPRNGDNRASFVIFDTEFNNFEFVKLDYNISAVQKKILDNNLPDVLAKRLAEGL